MAIFKDVEIVDMGIEKEKCRREFYDQVAQSFEDNEIKDLFTRLRDWEDRHIEKFTQIRQNMKGYETKGSYPEEMQAYIEALVDDRLYNQVEPRDFKENIKTPLDAIQRGMEFEKDAILFFNFLMHYVHDTQKEVIKQLIDEERQHIVYLFGLRSKYDS